MAIHVSCVKGSLTGLSFAPGAHCGSKVKSDRPEADITYVRQLNRRGDTRLIRSPRPALEVGSFAKSGSGVPRYGGSIDLHRQWELHSLQVQGLRRGVSVDCFYEGRTCSSSTG
jgi:hypothetical protein